MFASIIKKDSGDTIIEVLIAIAVVSSVLALTYVTMNRNLLLTRDAQERTEASKLAQGQIEAMKALSDAGVTIPATPFCIASGTVTAVSGGSPIPDYTTDPFINYPAECTSGFYRFAIKRDAVDVKLYRFYVRWDRVDGSSRNQVTMVYRK